MSISSMLGIGGERVQVAHHEIDRLDAVLGHVGAVLGLGRIGQQPAVDLRVQGDDAVIEDRRHARELGEIGDRRAGLGDRLGGAAAADDAPAQLVQARRRARRCRSCRTRRAARWAWLRQYAMTGITRSGSLQGVRCALAEFVRTGGKCGSEQVQDIRLVEGRRSRRLSDLRLLRLGHSRWPADRQRSGRQRLRLLLDRHAAVDPGPRDWASSRSCWRPAR